MKWDCFLSVPQINFNNEIQFFPNHVHDQIAYILHLKIAPVKIQQDLLNSFWEKCSP